MTASGFSGLKEIRNYKRKLFLCPSQKWVQTQSTFETAMFQNKFTFKCIKLNMYIRKTKFTSHKQYLFDVLFYRNAKKAHTDQGIQ